MELAIPPSPKRDTDHTLQMLRLDLIGLAHDEARAGHLDTAIDLYTEAGASAYLTFLGSEALAAGNVRIAIRAFTAVEWEIPRQALLDAVEERMEYDAADAPARKVFTIGTPGILVGMAALAGFAWALYFLGAVPPAPLHIVVISTVLVAFALTVAAASTRNRTSQAEPLVCDRETQARSRLIQKALREFREARAAYLTP